MDRPERSLRRVAGAVVAIALVAALTGTVAFAATRTSPPATADPMAGMGAMHHSTAAQAFHDDLRRLWEDHITWTRLFIVSFTADLPDLPFTTKRLLRNQVDIGNAVRPFYGRHAAHRLTVLLTTHITTAADVLAAAKDGHANAFTRAKTAWYANARQIAGFLHRANPANWSLRDLRAMMREHLDLTLAEAADHLQGHYRRDVADYDAVHREILAMADMLSDGIIAQFPAEF
jgi:hypothetical protein